MASEAEGAADRRAAEEERAGTARRGKEIDGRFQLGLRRKALHKDSRPLREKPCRLIAAERAKEADAYFRPDKAVVGQWKNPAPPRKTMEGFEPEDPNSDVGAELKTGDVVGRNKVPPRKNECSCER